MQTERVYQERALGTRLINHDWLLELVENPSSCIQSCGFIHFRVEGGGGAPVSERGGDTRSEARGTMGGRKLGTRKIIGNNSLLICEIIQVNKHVDLERHLLVNQIRLL